jgi:hypothetical protein
VSTYTTGAVPWNTATTTATTETFYISIPDGPLIKGRVKVVGGTAPRPNRVHPRRPHLWREMLHYGQRGTGFAQCRCGAIGVPYDGDCT